MPSQNDSSSDVRKTYGLSVIVALLIIVGLGGWFVYYTFHEGSLVDDTLREQFVWHLVPAAPLPDTPGPQTAITLEIAGADLPTGTYAGTCSIIDGANATLMSGELSGVICRTDAGGTEIAVFRDADDKLVLKKGAITTAGGRGQDFTPVVQSTTTQP
ncbi:MAG TPA: hypothetical protein VG934_00710 [Candidatus Paceibacterota bacterium]|nr:hypothetical protein [Candidatus Paceibacterota bacterium]